MEEDQAVHFAQFVRIWVQNNGIEMLVPELFALSRILRFDRIPYNEKRIRASVLLPFPSQKARRWSVVFARVYDWSKVDVDADFGDIEDWWFYTLWGYCGSSYRWPILRMLLDGGARSITFSGVYMCAVLGLQMSENPSFRVKRREAALLARINKREMLLADFPPDTFELATRQRMEQHIIANELGSFDVTFDAEIDFKTFIFVVSESRGYAHWVGLVRDVCCVLTAAAPRVAPWDASRYTLPRFVMHQIGILSFENFRGVRHSLGIRKLVFVGNSELYELAKLAFRPKESNVTIVSFEP